jgi:hypothetical protein
LFDPLSANWIYGLPPENSEQCKEDFALAGSAIFIPAGDTLLAGYSVPDLTAEGGPYIVNAGLTGIVGLSDFRL